MQTPAIAEAPFSRPRKLSHHEARTEQRVYWSRKSIPERLEAAAALTRRLYEMRGIAYDEPKADFTPSRIRRRRC